MNSLIIDPTTKSPSVSLLNTGELKISGTSVPEDVINYFQPILNWTTEFKKSNPAKVSLTLDFVYLNTSSTIFILKMLKSLHELYSKSCDLKIIWKFDDDDMLEQGEILQTLSKCKIDFVKSRH